MVSLSNASTSAGLADSVRSLSLKIALIAATVLIYFLRISFDFFAIFSSPSPYFEFCCQYFLDGVSVFLLFKSSQTRKNLRQRL